MTGPRIVRCRTCRDHGYIEVEVDGHEVDRICPSCLDGMND